MPKVVDAARVTTRDNTVWRTCTSCSELKPLLDDIERCAECTAPKPSTAAEAGWQVAKHYAELVGRISAWTDEKIPGFSDTERLAQIRRLLEDGKAVK
ncbi:hypothetical protein AB0F72_41510 [Actinoplanes sp. NPDC023936]|uniref:hypothetical protein n=1 Tax=Actinoplanes sp. NPDC023936 TaxID=3154910 RepID=UPI0033D5C47C